MIQLIDETKAQGDTLGGMFEVQAQDPIAVKRFLREAEFGVRVVHPNVVRTWEYGEDAGNYFLALEWAEGEALELFAAQTDEGPCVDCCRRGEPVVNADLVEARERWPRFAPAALAAGENEQALSAVRRARALRQDWEQAVLLEAQLLQPGSDMARAPTCSPEQSFGRYFSFCSALPFFCSWFRHRLECAP